VHTLIILHIVEIKVEHKRGNLQDGESRWVLLTSGAFDVGAIDTLVARRGCLEKRECREVAAKLCKRKWQDTSSLNMEACHAVYFSQVPQPTQP